MKIINCAIIGFGNIGKIQAEFLIRNKNTNLKYIYEKNYEIKKKFKNSIKQAKWISSENEIFRDKQIDLVLICSYDNDHSKQILKSIKYNKSVFCEKPICQNLKQLKNIDNFIKKNKSIRFSSNLILRSVKEYKYIKNIIDKKKIGQIFYCEGDYNYGRLNKIIKGWRGKIPFYSVVSGGAVHLIDIICNNLNEYPNSVYASSNKIVTKNSKFKYQDLVVSILKFKSGIISKISANFGCKTRHHHQLKFFGKDGTFFKDYDKSKIIFNNDSNEENSKVIKFEKKYNKSEILKKFINQFNSNLKNNNLPKYEEVAKVMLVCFAIEKSFKKNKEIKINYKKLNLEII